MRAEPALPRHCRVRRSVVLGFAGAGLAAWLPGCGGGDGPAPDTKERPTAQAAGDVQVLDTDLTGPPIGVSAARGPNGDAMVVWRTEADLWASRYEAAAGAWRAPVRVDTGGGHGPEVQGLVVDARGNAVLVVWRQGGDSTVSVVSVWFDAATGAWAAPRALAPPFRQASVAGNAAGQVMVAYADGVVQFIDTATGAPGPAERYAAAPFSSAGITAALDGEGHALVVFNETQPDTPTFSTALRSNHRRADTQAWGELPREPGGAVGTLPGSQVSGFHRGPFVGATGGGHFVAAWQGIVQDDWSQDIRVSRFAPAANAWTTARTAVPGRPRVDMTFRGMGGDSTGRALLLWTEDDRKALSLRALQLDADGAACGAVQTVDTGPTGISGSAGLVVDPASGNALALWSRFDEPTGLNGPYVERLAISRFDRRQGRWEPAFLPDAASDRSGRASAAVSGDRAVVAWISRTGGVDRLKVVLLPLGSEAAP
jgi:hypothetical protein